MPPEAESKSRSLRPTPKRSLVTTGERADRYAQLKLAGLDDAPVHYAVFADHGTCQGHGLGRRTMPETLDYSVASSIMLFWMAARAEGIGVGWVSILDPAKITELLDVPVQWRFIAYLCVGWPQEHEVTPELESQGWQNANVGWARCSSSITLTLELPNIGFEGKSGFNEGNADL